MLVRRSDAIAVGPYDANLKTSEDRLFTLALFLRGSAIFDPQVHCHVRKHAESSTAEAKRLSVSYEKLKVLEKCRTLIGTKFDAEDDQILALARAKAERDIRWYSSAEGLAQYLQAPGALTHYKTLMRAAVKQPLRRMFNL